MKVDLSYWQGYADAIGIRRGERLSNAPRGGGMSKALIDLLHVFHDSSFTQSQIADILNQIGVLAADGNVVSNSNVSNTMRKSLELHRVKQYSKPEYQGKNWQYYS